MKTNTKIENYDFKTFNHLFDTQINENMDVIEVHTELEQIFSISCGIVATSKAEALEKVLNYCDEYIINLENTFYLCVRDVKEIWEV